MKAPHWKPCIEVWMSFYKVKTGQSYAFAPIDAANLKQLLRKIEFKILDKGMEVTPDMLTNSLNGFLSSISDKWILEHLELKNVNSNFNTLYVKAINKSFINRGQQIDDIISGRHSKGANG